MAIQSTSGRLVSSCSIETENRLGSVNSNYVQRMSKQSARSLQGIKC